MPRRTVRRTGPARCRECDAHIVFVQMTYTGNRMPVDPIPVADGNVCARRIGQRLHGWVISEDHPAGGPPLQRYAAHFGTCPTRQDARAAKPKPPDPPALFDLPQGAK